MGLLWNHRSDVQKNNGMNFWAAIRCFRRGNHGGLMQNSVILLLSLLLGGLAFLYFRTVKRQKAWEAERSKDDQQLQLAAHAMEHTIDGIMVLGADRRILSVNKGFVNITGYPADEVIGHSPRMLHSSRHDEKFYKELWNTLRKEGQWKGEIWDKRKSGQLYAQLLSLSAVRDAEQKVTHYIGTFNDISQYKDYEAALEFLANHDPLTNLPNRMLFNDRLDDAIIKAVQEKSRVCVIFIDLDRFKMVNDSLGHEIGDRLLQEISGRLQANVPPGETVARLGGDEFTVVLERVEDIQAAAIIAERLLAVIEKPALIDAHQLFVSASIGISFYPQDGQDATTLLKHADTAMYRAKEEGRDKIKFFAPEMNLRAKEFMVMANSLHVALERKQLTVEYQPRVDLLTGKIVGVEALARWRHPELGWVSPEKFIPLAEETGLIVPIGEWIMQTACKQGKIWMDAGYPLLVAVNLSVRQFGRAGLVPFILDTIRAFEYSTDLLEVEVTESLMMNDPHNIMETLVDISRHGIRIAIDDFGTGYSSLSYLKQFPVDYLKIDKSFVRDTPGDPDSVAIVKTIIAMAKSLRLSLIAEGVETEAQRQFLVEQGCEAAQGFYFSRSLPAADILPLLEKAGTAQLSHAE